MGNQYAKVRRIASHVTQQGFMGTTDPAALDSLIEDCQASGLLT